MSTTRAKRFAKAGGSKNSGDHSWSLTLALPFFTCHLVHMRQGNNYPHKEVNLKSQPLSQLLSMEVGIAHGEFGYLRSPVVKLHIMNSNEAYAPMNLMAFRAYPAIGLITPSLCHRDFHGCGQPFA